MITASLISDSAWSEAPADSREAFLFLATTARGRLTELLQGDDAERGPYPAREWERQYVWELTSIANGLGIAGLPAPEHAQQSASTLAEFDAQLARIITSIKVDLRANLRTESVELAYATKADIRSELEKLRAMINTSNVAESLKAALHKKVDAVEAELDYKRSSLRPFWLLAGALAAAAPAAVGTLADLPGATQTVQNLLERVHQEKADEDQAELRKTQPPRITHEPVRQLEDKSGGRKRGAVKG